jgi:hypothetical protein
MPALSPTASLTRDPALLTLTASGPLDGDGPRERAASLGLEALGDEDLLALVLGTGAGGESVRLLATPGGCSASCDAAREGSPRSAASDR